MITSQGKPEKCPRCGSKSIADILYGYPAFDEKMQRDLDAGKIVLGGCCISGFDPSWQCLDCETEIYKSRHSE